ncbi:MAG TPA: hypothetical protein VII51_03300 [Gaiellaceae bacterium]
MAEPSWPSHVDLSAYLNDLDAVQQKFRLPPPVVVLTADLLKKVPRRLSVRNASELVAALLVGAAEQSADALGEMVADYRDTQAHEILGSAATTGPFEIPLRADLELS